MPCSPRRCRCQALRAVTSEAVDRPQSWWTRTPSIWIWVMCQMIPVIFFYFLMHAPFMGWRQFYRSERGHGFRHSIVGIERHLVGHSQSIDPILHILLIFGLQDQNSVKLASQISAIDVIYPCSYRDGEITSKQYRRS